MSAPGGPSGPIGNPSPEPDRCRRWPTQTLFPTAKQHRWRDRIGCDTPWSTSQCKRCVEVEVCRGTRGKSIWCRVTRSGGAMRAEQRWNSAWSRGSRPWVSRNSSCLSNSRDVVEVDGLRFGDRRRAPAKPCAAPCPVQQPNYNRIALGRCRYRRIVSTPVASSGASCGWCRTCDSVGCPGLIAARL